MYARCYQVSRFFSDDVKYSLIIIGKFQPVACPLASSKLKMWTNCTFWVRKGQGMFFWTEQLLALPSKDYYQELYLMKYTWCEKCFEWKLHICMMMITLVYVMKRFGGNLKKFHLLEERECRMYSQENCGTFLRQSRYHCSQKRSSCDNWNFIAWSEYYKTMNCVSREFFTAS